jgi:hypothetical protein
MKFLWSLFCIFRADEANHLLHEFKSGRSKMTADQIDDPANHPVVLQKACQGFDCRHLKPGNETKQIHYRKLGKLYMDMIRLDIIHNLEDPSQSLHTRYTLAQQSLKYLAGVDAVKGPFDTAMDYWLQQEADII